MLRTLFLFLFFAACSNYSAADIEAAPYTKTNILSDSTLIDIQSKIKTAFITGIVSGDPSELETINLKLEALQKKSPQNLIAYWMSYNDYYRAILHGQHKDKDASEKAINSAVERMEDLKNKNSEDYALLAMAQGYSMQFMGMKAAFYSKKVAANIEKAQTLEPENIRAWYVAGSNDFYTPAQYGGGKKAEEYLLKAIACPDQKIANPYLPSWGREEAYEMLLQHYIKVENWEVAKAHFQKAAALYPQNFRINQLAAKLVGK